MMALEKVNLQIGAVRASLSSLRDKMKGSSISLPLTTVYERELQRFEQGLHLGERLALLEKELEEENEPRMSSYDNAIF